MSRALLVVALFAAPALAQPKVPAYYPTLTTLANFGASGGTTEVTFTGTNLADATAILCDAPGVTFTIGAKEAAKLTAKVTVPPTAPVGVFAVRVATVEGVSNARPFCLDQLPPVPKKPDISKKESAQLLAPPCVVTGTIANEASDFFRVALKAGQTITFEAVARRTGSPLDPTLILRDAKSGQELPGLYAEDTPGLQTDARITHTFATATEVIVELRDSTYKGGPEHAYRFRVGNFPNAMTAFPLAVEAGKEVAVRAAGPDARALPAKPAAGNFTPRLADGPPGWAVPVAVSAHPELVEQEPNNDIKQANRVPVPGGISASFATKGDLDYFAFAGKKAQKLEVVADTVLLNAPTEVYLRILDAKGAELAKSDPMKPTAKVEFAPPADGEFFAVAEHLNYQYGPTEVYHLTIRPLVPEADVSVGLDRFDLPADGASVVPITGLAKLNGFNAPLTLTFAGIEGVTGTLTIPAAAIPTPQAPLYMPILCAKAKPGAYTVRILAGTKPATAGEIAKATFANLPNLPPEWAAQLVAVVVAKPLATLQVTRTAPTKLKVTATRREGFADEIVLAALVAPPGVTVKVKPIPKGANDVELDVATDPKTAAAGTLILRGTAKDRTFTTAPLPVPVSVPVVPPPAPAVKKVAPPPGIIPG